jgi:xylose dehydrogenase (NAD/NADP)
MSKVIWGVLGCSGHAHKRAVPAMLRSPSVQLLGAASRSVEKAASFCAQFGLERSFASYEAMLENPQIQAVYISLPNSLHAEWIIKAAEKGKHVLCEKPLTINAAEAARVRDVAARTGVRIMEAFMWRFHIQHLKTRELIHDGNIGSLRLVRASFSYLRTRNPNVRLVSDLGGGSLLDIGCYPISIARFYFEDEPMSVFAESDFDREFGVDMRVSSILNFPQGKALIDCAFDLPYRTEVELVGEKGTILFPKPWAPDPQATILINGKPETFEAQDHFVSQFEHFSQCLLQGIEPSYGPKDALRQMRVIDATFKSMTDNSVTKIG